MADQPSRIAIQLGKPAGASPHGIKKRTRPAHGKRHRAHALNEGSESENSDDDHQQANGRHKVITSYDIHGGSLDNDGAGQYENPRRDGRDAKGKQKDKPSDETGTTDGGGGVAADSSESADKPVKWGLTINMKGKTGTKHNGQELKSRISAPDSEGDSTGHKGHTKSIDEEALDALMGSKSTKRKYIDSDAADRDPRPEDYKVVPIDDFGATLLKRFGWDGKMKGKVKEVTRHANLTGLGAKDAKGAEDLGAWNQKAGKDSRPVRLEDYQREERKKRQRVDDRYADSYKREREREREQGRERGRDR
ncbi:uncharacterized protein B0T15DRAFT_317574 [Chaetomium strumarium]|uniref:Spp2/MOS2 G-patch domain-containing protein n=1 Tax=Chaetomium strumarium TaxID=1170767 RepID=A0AAJ0LXR7_9PEZI|nr:hypothetical protein B0T15DRAFT_317574 [Chaetomium strumarium]